MASDIEIAQQAKLQRITDVAAKLGIADEHLEPYGHYKAKVSLDYLDRLPARPNAKLILVTAISPTPAGEGKTTTTVGLGDALNRIGKRAIVCLREPSLGPVFGVKGGAAGGGYAQVVPMEDINLHFTGDFNAIGLANNLLAAMIDNHIHHGNELGIDVRRVTWKRVVDMNDRALRDITVSLGGPANGYPREDGFDIVVASEVMAIFCLATSIADLKERLGNIVIGYTREQKPVTARDLKAHGAMTVLLKDALKPNLVQTLENNPAILHGGPFANIAHGCNSVIATQASLKLGDYVVTEAGFGADLGAEKFIDIKCRKSGLRPDAVVIVATLRALKYHGGVDVKNVSQENLAALEAGIAAYEAVRAGSWKPAEPFPDFDAALMRAAAAAGLLRLGVLRRRADGVPVAAQYWVLDRGGTRASVLKLSHLESERAASPGTALTALMIQGLLADDGVQELDFGRGDDAYKRLWVGTARRRIGLVVADPMHPAGLAAIARQGLGALRRRWMRKDGRAA